MKLGYIASSSSHSTGAAVDLTLVPLTPIQAESSNLPAVSVYGACNAATATREGDNSLDMGTTFDCFDQMSHTQTNGITAEQRENRRLLVDAMLARKFTNYFREWWQFTYGELHDLPKQDFVITK